jgi:hypothetical protein
MPALANATMFHGITETLQPKRSVANRTNQVMKVLIVLGAVALPALVISMLYGMMSMKCVSPFVIAALLASPAAARSTVDLPRRGPAARAQLVSAGRSLRLPAQPREPALRARPAAL